MAQAAAVAAATGHPLNDTTLDTRRVTVTTRRYYRVCKLIQQHRLSPDIAPKTLPTNCFNLQYLLSAAVFHYTTPSK